MTSQPVRYARLVDGTWKCVSNLKMDILPVTSDLTNIPMEDLSLHEFACINPVGELIECQPAGNAHSHFDNSGSSAQKSI